MDPYTSPYEPLNLLVVVRRAPRLVLPARETPRTIFYLPAVSAHAGFGSILSSHIILFEAQHQQGFGHYYHEGGEVRSPSHEIVRGLEKVLCSYYPLAGRLRAPTAGSDRSKLELVCHGQGAVFVEAQSNISLAELKKLDKAYWSELQYEFVGDTPIDVPPLVVQVTTLTCGGFVVSVRVLQSLCDSAGILHFLHAWSELTKSSQNVNITVPLWGGMVPAQLSEWPQKFHFPSLELAHGPEEYAHSRDNKLHYMESTRDQSYYDNVSNDHKFPYMETRDQPYYDNVHGLGHDHKLQHVETRDQPYYANVLGLSNISISLEDLNMLKDSTHIKCNKFEALAALFWRERTRALELPLSSEVLLFFPAPVAHDLHLAFYGQYGFNCVVSARAGDLIQRELGEVVGMIQEAKAFLEVNFIQCMKKFVQVHCPAKQAPPHALIFTVLWDGVCDIDFGMGGAPYAPDATRLRSPVNVAAITGALEDTIEIVMTNAPQGLVDKINLRSLLLPTRPYSDSRL